LLLLFGVALARAIVPGLFTVDETAYVASVASLRAGRLTPPGYEGLRPSVEHYFFDPDPGPAHPVVPPPIRFPPLYAFLAWPWSWLGVRGLFALNVAATLWTAALVFLRLERVGTRSATPWLGALAFLFGGHVLEYALGLWPHMLSTALCTSAFVLAALARERGDARAAAASGLVVGLAIGVRYPNVVIAVGLGAGLLLLAVRRGRVLTGYFAGLALPLFASALCNFARLGSWNPISKGGGYLTPDATNAGVSGFLADLWPSFASRVIDYRLRSAVTYGFFAEHPDPSGAYVWTDVAKKAWLQSSPWVVVSLLVLVAVWRRRAQSAGDAASRARNELRALSLVVFAVFGALTLAGSARTDGFCFNQRYLIDLVPFAAMALALGLDPLELPIHGLVVGAAVGLCTGFATFRLVYATEHHAAVMSAPLWIAAVAAVGWVVSALRRGQWLLCAGVAAGLAYAPVVHVFDDVRASRARRKEVAQVGDSVRGRLPDGVAVLAWHGYRDAVAPLLLTQRLTIIEPSRDAGMDAMRVARDLLAHERRVFVIANGSDPGRPARLGREFGIKNLYQHEIVLFELEAWRPAPAQ